MPLVQPREKDYIRCKKFPSMFVIVNVDKRTPTLFYQNEYWIANNHNFYKTSIICGFNF